MKTETTIHLPEATQTLLSSQGKNINPYSGYEIPIDFDWARKEMDSAEATEEKSDDLEIEFQFIAGRWIPLPQGTD